MNDYLIDPRMPYMQSPDIYDDYSHMLLMPEDQLERMYPKIYYMINPVIIRQCDIMEEAYGPDYTPTREELERMIDHIMYDVESRLSEEMMEEMSQGNPSGNPSNNPRGNPDGRGFLRDLTGILLIRELLRRRRSPFRRRGFFPRYPFFPGYPGFYPYF